MQSVKEILAASGPELCSWLQGFDASAGQSLNDRLATIARSAGLNTSSVICAIGFNSRALQETAIAGLLGQDSIGGLIKLRNKLFSRDIYRQIGIARLEELYQGIRHDQDLIETLPPVLLARMSCIEETIEGTINTRVIDNYKLEIKTLYALGIGQIEFAESRLALSDNGYRAMNNEVSLIVEHRIIPAGDLFFRDTVLPEEKKKLIAKGLIPEDLIISRLTDTDISMAERKMLKSFV